MRLPKEGIASLACGWQSSAAVDGCGRLWMWGRLLDTRHVDALFKRYGPSLHAPAKEDRTTTHGLHGHGPSLDGLHGLHGLPLHDSSRGGGAHGGMGVQGGPSLHGGGRGSSSATSSSVVLPQGVKWSWAGFGGSQPTLVEGLPKVSAVALGGWHALCLVD